MRLAAPAGLWLAALAVPILVLHALRPRRPSVTVSSTFLWTGESAPVSAARPWQRIRPSVLLLLQLAAIMLLALAAARPVRVTAAPLARHTVFVIDTSGSMAAMDGRPDRLAQARAKATSLRRQLPTGGLASIVVASAQPRVILSGSSDPHAFTEALGRVRTAGGAADFVTAFSLAESLETPAAPLGIVLLSDGGLTDIQRDRIPPGTRYERIGSRATNRSITGLTVEPRGTGLHARFTVRNNSGGAATQRVRVDVDGRTAATLSVTLESGSKSEREVDLPAGQRVDAFLEGDDLLSADNRAVAVAGHRRDLRVLQAGPDNVYLDRLLKTIPGVIVERSPDGRPAPGFDLAIYDRVAVPADPGAPFVAVAPPGGAPGVKVAGTDERPVPSLVRADDPLLRGLDLSELAIGDAQRLDAPAAQVLVGSESSPLIIRSTAAGRPYVYMGFALDRSNLPLLVAFPVLGDRLLTELSGATIAPPALRVGQPFPPLSGSGAGTSASAVSIEGPDGTITPVPAGGLPPVADRPGYWLIHQAGRPDQVVAVNPDPAESDVAPAPSLPVRPLSTGNGRGRQGGELSLLRWFLVALLIVLALELILGRRARAVPARQWRAALVVRAVIVGLLVVALVAPTLHRTGRRVAVMFLVDGSDSLGPDGRQQAAAWVRDALAHQPRTALAGVAYFGGNARLELTMQHRARLGNPAVQVDTTRTDLAAGLRLAQAVLPSSARRRVVIVSDGRATQGDAAGEAARLRAAGVRVDVHPIGRAGNDDLAVLRLDAPTLVRQGELVPLRATITSSQAQAARITVERDGQVVAERVVDVPAGETVVELPDTPTGPGLARYRVRIQAAADAVPENDVGYAAVRIEGPARVLVVEGGANEAAALVSALRAGGINVTVVPPSGLPSVDELSGFDATVLVDVDANALSTAQVAALTAATRDVGRGLVAIGGDHSYALGGYLDSDLEALLPVRSDLDDPKRRPSVAEVLAIDTSGSMTACHCRPGSSGPGGMGGGGMLEGGVNKTEISKAAAARAIAALQATDQVGVLAFNSEHKFVLPLAPVPAADVVERGLGQLQPSGGTEIPTALDAAGKALREANAALRHIILFTDGFTSQDALATLRQQAAQLHADGITVSVLATGEGAAESLRAVAEAGGGRFYPGHDLNEIPQIMSEEAVLATRSFVNEGTFYPRITSGAAAVRDLQSAPPILGYIATSVKPAASKALEIGDSGDPLLASWQIGLGRATAWTSDASARWSKQWASWEGYVSFWTAAVKDTFPISAGSGSARAEIDGDRIKVTVESEQPFPDGAHGSARLVGPDATASDLPLERTSATTFTGEASEGSASAAGTYTVGTSVIDESGRPVLAATALASQSYPPEYRPGPIATSELVRLSSISGGRGEIEAAVAFRSSGLPPGRTRTVLTGWLLLVAALLWPIDVALRRLAFAGAGPGMPKPSVAGGLRRLRRLRLRERGPTRAAEKPISRPDGDTVPVADERVDPPTTVGRLLDKKRETRDRR